MRRRDFIKGIAGSTVGWPFAASAQRSAVPVIGFLNSGSPEGFAPYVASFRDALSDLGYVDGRNLRFEYRWARSHNDQLPALAADLVKAQVSVIAGVNSTPAVRAAKVATAAFPIVFTIGADPVKVGLVDTFNRPGGNVTGISYHSNALLPKRLELLQALVPGAQTFGFLVNPNNPNAASDVEETQTAARTIGQNLVVTNAGSEADFDAAFASLAQQQVQALLVDVDALFTSRPEQIVALAAGAKIPALYDKREFVVAGGLIGYGSSLADAYRQSGIYTGRILKGEKPSDLPVMRPTKFELVINLKTAEALGLTVPPTLLARADEVIE